MRVFAPTFALLINEKHFVFSTILLIPAETRNYQPKTRQNMKAGIHQPIIQLSQPELDELCRLVPETVAVAPIKLKQKRRFGVADLWNIHRNSRSRVQRRLN